MEHGQTGRTTKQTQIHNITKYEEVINHERLDKNVRLLDNRIHAD